MSTLVRILAAFCLLLVCTATALFDVWTPADAKLSEMRFAAADRAPSGDIVFVDIDAESLAAIGTWPWPRSLHGQMLDRLIALGAYEVAFDIDFSARSTPVEDAAFARSLENAGGYAYLAAFRQRTASGTDIWSRPLPEFAAHADEALVNVDGLKGGLIWSLPGSDASTGLPSIAARFSSAEVPPRTLRIDYAIDLNQIVTVSAKALLNDAVDPALIQDKQVIIGTSAIELHDLHLAPRFGVIPGAIVQIAAAETLKLGRPLADLGPWPALILASLLLLGSALLPKLRLGPALGIALVWCAAVEASAFAVYAIFALQFDTAPFHFIAASVLIVRLIDERIIRRRQLRKQHARLVYLANHDDHTGALSQHAWIDAAETWIGQDKLAGTLLFRVEQAENAGASLGFRLADEAIRQFHDRLRASVLGPVGRLESQVFAVGLDRPLSQAELSGLIQQLERPYAVEGHRIALKVRWGSAEPESGKSAGLLLQEARTALAMARRKGLIGCPYAMDFEIEFQRRRQIDIALRSAVARNELDLAFQAQVETRTRQTVGVEALLRWQSAELGWISPGEFIPLAEENGTIIALGRWVAHEACRRAVEKGWQGRLSINVAPAQFAQSDVVAMVQSALEQSGFPAERLDVEITESLVAGGHLSIVETLHRLQALGASIAIDDFGTGHSSLSYLASLPVDKLKIDQSFVRQMQTPRGAEVIKTIVALGNGLGLSIVVEGVETEAELAGLAALNCDTVQGYLFGKPGPLPQSQSEDIEAA